MGKKSTKEKIKEKIEEFKEKKKKILGDPKITGVTRPKKQDPDDKRKRGRHGTTVVGPRGGQYVQTESGKKRYTGPLDSLRWKLVVSLTE